MAEVKMIDVEDHTTPKDSPLVNGPDRPNKSTKRKRPQTPSIRAVTAMSTEERESRIDGLNNELDGLFKYYKEILSEKSEIGVLSSIEKKEKMECVIACLIEESELPLSKLVEGVYEKLKGTEGVSVTMASVKNSVLFVGQRLAYGVSNADADVLEDDSGSCLWCWEARDLKLLPKVVRGILQIRRTCRKKINERISAITAMVSALKNLENCQNYKRDIMKASEKLLKVLSEADIRLLMDSMTQKNGADKADKEAKREEKLLIKQLEKSKREAEKEKKTMERESEKEKCQNEKELKRLNEESEKRREKEETEMRKQLRRQQEEAEKDQKRRDKEEAELKRQRAIQKQASILERFLKKSQDTSPGQNEKSSTKVAVAGSFSMSNEKLPEAVTLSMDSALSQNDEINTEDIRKLHYTSWHNLGQNIRSNRKQHWGIRRKPKTAMIKELKLTNTRELVCDDNLNVDKPVHACEGTNRDDRPFQTIADSSSPSTHLSYRSKQLLQFDKSHRPAFYGICRKRSNIVRPHNPFRKDPDLDYDIDSDEEWEEEDPGESLSDCEKDNEEESIDEGCIKADDEEESEDGFFVPDGYLSENEGVEVDRMETDSMNEEAGISPDSKPQIESEEFCKMFKQQKHLHNLTEHALKKNQPMIILNLKHEKDPFLMSEDPIGTEKHEHMCLQALCIRPFPGSPLIEISVDDCTQDEDQEVCYTNNRGSSTLVSATPTITDADLPKIVHAIKSYSQGINQVVDSLQETFPAISKSHLRNKVRDISDFVDNRWQVKKEILDKLGISPAKTSRGTKSIATFFSKRCMPPSGGTMSHTETSPELSQKRSPAVRGESNSTQKQL